MTTLVTVIIAVLAAIGGWFFRGRYEYKRSEKFKEQQEQRRKNAKETLLRLRGFKNLIKDRIPSKVEVESVRAYGDLYLPVEELGGTKALKAMGTTPQEIAQLTKEYIDYKKQYDSVGNHMEVFVGSFALMNWTEAVEFAKKFNERGWRLPCYHDDLSFRNRLPEPTLYAEYWLEDTNQAEYFFGQGMTFWARSAGVGTKDKGSKLYVCLVRERTEKSYL